MTMRRSYLIAGLLATMALQQAQADAGGPWSGCRGGVHGGHGWAPISGRYVASPTPWFGNDIGSATATGWFLGGQLGCDRQDGQWVWGGQASLAWADMAGSHQFLHGSGPSNRVTYRIRALGTLTGRLGYVPAPETLAYLRAGAAWTKTNHDDSDPAPLGGPAYTGSQEARRSGWLAGIGLERRIDRSRSYYLEYAHMDFGHANVAISYSDGPVIDYAFRQRLDALAVGLNYRF